MNCPPLSAVCSMIRSWTGLAENRLSGNANGPEMPIGAGSSVLARDCFHPGTRIRGTDGRMSDCILGAGGRSPAPLLLFLLSAAITVLNCGGAGVPRLSCGGGGGAGTGVPRPLAGKDGGGCCSSSGPCAS